MELKLGELFLAEVDGEEKVVYLSLMTEEKGLERRDHCYRTAPPENSIIKGEVKFKARINPQHTWQYARTRQQHTS